MLTVADQNYSVHQSTHQFLQNLPVAAAGIGYTLGVLVSHSQKLNVAAEG
jgi:hypothetical protein